MSVVCCLLSVVCCFVGVPQLLEADDMTAAEAHLTDGRRAYDTGDYERAHREFERALQLVDADRAPVAPAASDALASRDHSQLSTLNSATGSPADPDVMPYLITAGDVLVITVWQVPDLTREAIVRPDGKLAYPLIGEVPADGLTLSELHRLLTERFALYVRNPQVSVELKTMAQQRIVVLGEVNKQGVHPFPGRTIGVPEAIGLGEGFKRIGAKVKDVAVLTGYPRQPRLHHVNVKTLLLQGRDPQRLALAGGDIIFVSRSWVGNVHAFIDAATPMLSTIFQGISAYSLYDNLPSNK